VQYTAAMPTDVPATVMVNQPLSTDYNVVSLAAPDIARVATPGQFVMLKVAAGCDPLLRRPFSIFQVLRDPHGVPTGFTVLNKRVGRSSTLLYSVCPGQQVACLGPLGRGFTPVEPPAEAWMVAGGVGVAPFGELAVALRARGARTTLFYGARSAAELFFLASFRDLGTELVLTTEDGSLGERGHVVAPLERRLASRAPENPVTIYACGPDRMLSAAARTAERFGRPCEVSVERLMGCGLGGCYSCVVPMRDGHGGYHHVRSCLAGPVLAGDQVVWE
jgi:dihydroorotate dehydrogenase electron transfer subunit